MLGVWFVIRWSSYIIHVIISDSQSWIKGTLRCNILIFVVEETQFPVKFPWNSMSPEWKRNYHFFVVFLFHFFWLKSGCFCLCSSFPTYSLLCFFAFPLLCFFASLPFRFFAFLPLQCSACLLFLSFPASLLLCFFAIFSCLKCLNWTKSFNEL